MPVFEFKCQKCGRMFEKFVLSARSESDRCPGCGSDNVRRMFSSFSSRGGSAAGGNSGSCLPSG